MYSEKKCKIAHILHCVGGVEVSLRLIANNIDSGKFENIVIHGFCDTKKPFLDNNKNLLKEYKTTIYRQISFVNDSKAIYHSYKILKEQKPNIIHVHSAKGGIIGRIVGLLLNTKVLFTPQAFSYLSEERGMKKSLFLMIEKVFSKTNNILLASSQSELDRGIVEVGYKKQNTLLFSNCINEIEEIKPLSIDKTWPDEYICTVGRPSYQKNIELMLNVFFEVRKQNNIHLVIMGVGHHVGQLETVKKLVLDLGLSNNVTILNWTRREDVLNIIKNSKLYISTARYEGMPYSIIEALSLSKPCIVSDCDGNKDLIIDGYNGFVVKNKDVQKYVAKIQLLLNDKEIYSQISFNAFESFENEYNFVNNIKKLEDIYIKQSNL